MPVSHTDAAEALAFLTIALVKAVVPPGEARVIAFHDITNSLDETRRHMSGGAKDILDSLVKSLLEGGG